MSHVKTWAQSNTNSWVEFGSQRRQMVRSVWYMQLAIDLPASGPQLLIRKNDTGALLASPT